MPTFEQAGRYYQELAKRLAAETIETAEAEVETLVREAERVSGFPAQFEDEDFGVQIPLLPLPRCPSARRCRTHTSGRGTTEPRRSLCPRLCGTT